MRLFTTGVATFAVLAALPDSSYATQEGRVKLAIQQGGREVGQETLELRAVPARGAANTELVSTARYPVAGSTLTIAATLVRTAEHTLAKFRMEVDSAGTRSDILAAGSGALLVVRTTAKGSESGRELPGGPDVVLLDDGAFSLYAQLVDLATPGGRALTGVFPRTGRRVAFSAQRADGSGGNTRVTLSGGLTGTVITDAQRRLVRLELPATQIVVTRLTSEP